MAESFLLQGNSASEAVRWAKMAIDREQVDRKTSEELGDINLGENMATLAWATAAESHNRAEVARLGDAAVASVGTHVVSSTAQVHYHLGRAFSELGDRPQSAQHYNEATSIDPQGEWARAAKAAMNVAAAV